MSKVAPAPKRVGVASMAVLTMVLGVGSAQADARGDFNGDSYADLVVGIPYREVGGHAAAGAVSIHYSGPPGTGFARVQVLHADSLDVAGEAEPDALFGWSLATTDFNLDGFYDLAVGVPGRTVNGRAHAGAVVILYGSPHGLTGAGSQEWTSDTPGVAGSAGSGDRFGWSLVTGATEEWMGGRFLAIGAPYEDVVYLAEPFLPRPGVPGWPPFPTPVPTKVTASNAGAVTVLYFPGPEGLSAAGSQEWTKDSPGVPGTPRPDDHFGADLAAGWFGGQGEEDLAIGVPGHDADGVADAGGVVTLYDLTRPSNVPSRLWVQGRDGVPGSPTPNARFGSVLAAGNFSVDDYRGGDLVIGLPYHQVGQEPACGAVVVLSRIQGTSALSTDMAGQLWHADVPGVPDQAEMYDLFGAALAVGDFNGDYHDDLAIGVPSEDRAYPFAFDWVENAGMVVVLYGSPSGLTTAGAQALAQWQTPLEAAERGDAFGAALAVLDRDGDGDDELVIGVPNESVRVTGTGEVPKAGGLHVMTGSPAGLTQGYFGALRTDSPPVPYMRFGMVLE